MLEFPIREDQGNGVWRVLCGMYDPEHALSEFRKDHPDLIITAMVLQPWGEHGGKAWILSVESTETLRMAPSRRRSKPTTYKKPLRSRWSKTDGGYDGF